MSEWEIFAASNRLRFHCVGCFDMYGDGCLSVFFFRDILFYVGNTYHHVSSSLFLQWFMNASVERLLHLKMCFWSTSTGLLKKVDEFIIHIFQGVSVLRK